ncbi:MAG: hypothetical protein V4689_10705 [Verrucomicrobiota bacterium]
MKLFLHTCGAVTFGCLLPLAAQTTETTTKSEVTRNADGSVTHSESITTTRFTADSRTGVVKYFDAFKNEPFGLPPAWVNQFRVNEIPVAWRVSTVGPGVVVPELERRHLVEAPPDLVKVLPAPLAGIRYYVAGSNVVAVDRSYKVVDSVRIPTIRFTDNNIPVQPVERVVVPAERVVQEVVPVERKVRVEMPSKENDDEDDDDDD